MSKALATAVPFRTRLFVSSRGIGHVLRRPKYIVLAVVVGMISMGAVLWSLNIGLLGFVLFEAPLTLIQKLEFLLNIYGSIATNYASFQALTITIFSVLFGFNIATLVYVFRRGQRNVWRSKGSGGSVMFAALGGGCAACGTAVITPLLGALGASASSALVSSIGNIALLIAIALTLYSIYSLGQRAASLQAQEANQQHNNNKEQS